VELTGLLTERAARYKMRSDGRRISALPRVSECGRPVGASHVAVVRTSGGFCRYDGLQQCASVWACPVCGPRIRQQRANDMSEGFGAHLSRGGGAALASFTVPHYSADDLAELWDAVSRSFSGMCQGASWRGSDVQVGLVQRFGVLGYVRVFETTHGANGWHPHLHVVYAFDVPLSELELQAFAAELSWLWERQVARKLGRQVNEHGADVRALRSRIDVERAVAYVEDANYGAAVWPIGNELLRGDRKVGRMSLTPQQLQRLAIAGDAEAANLWREFELVSKGKRCVTYSARMRDLLCLVDVDDDELLDDDEGQAVEVLALYSAAEYRSFDDHGAGGLVLDWFDDNTRGSP